MKRKVDPQLRMIFQFQSTKQTDAFLLDRRAAGLTVKTLKFFEERLCAGYFTHL